MKKLKLLILFYSITLGVIFAQSKTIDDSTEVKSLNKTLTSEDDAFGVLDKGELVNILGNQGMITDSYYQNLIYNFRWPKSKGLASATQDYNAIDDCSIIFGVKGNVLDSYTRYRNEDFMAPKGSKGKTHAEDQPAELLAPDGAPRLAHSDIPLTWPKGYLDENRNFHPAPTGPYESLSEADKKLVTSKGAWYDKEKNVWRFWPGKFRTDIDPKSPTFGKEVIGEFAADREVYAVMDDHNTQAPSKQIGLLYEIQAYSYGRRFAQDIQFYDITITNKSGQDLDSCYMGWYVDFQFGDVLEETWGSFNTGINKKGYDNAFYQFDYNGSSPGNPEIGYIGMAVLRTPFDMGVTDAHFFRDLTGSVTPGEDNQQWPVMISDPTSKNFIGTVSDYFHGTNKHFDDFSLTGVGKNPGPNNWSMYVTTGPFSMKKGESIKATLAFSAALNLEKLKKNFETAQSVFLNNFIGPAAPPSPTLKAIPGDKKVTLYWDDVAENAIDPVAKAKDFEGYKIYRSQDQGASWGQRITNSKGELVGFVPVAQFDKKDLITGVDPFNNYNYLGDDTGIVHVWEDTTVYNGINYSYTITAYDSGSVSKGFESLESSRGTTAADHNLVDVTPRSNPIGYNPEQINFEQISGVGNGEPKIMLVDPKSLQADNYLITFNKTPADSFYLINNKTKSVLTKAPLNSDEMLVSDGLKIRIDGDSKTGEIKAIKNGKEINVYGDTHLDPEGKWYVKDINKNSSANLEAKGADYEFRFTQKGSYASGLTGQNQSMIKKYKVPFEVWNVKSKNPFQINCILVDKNGNGALDFGEELRIVNVPYVEKADTVGTFNLQNWYYTISINTPTDSGGRLPIVGESFKIYSYSQLTTADSYKLNVVLPSISKEKSLVESEINKVRVVPNPFIVDAKWEQVKNTKRMRFMFLPPECTISIYTVSGEKVTTLYHNDNTGDEDWNLTNDSGVEIAFGMYIYVVQTPNGEKTIGKFAIIK